jgi:hypothetical protein
MEPLPRIQLPASRQLRIMFDSIKLRGMCPSERSEAIAVLARLLTEAARVAVEESGDERG